MNKNDLKKRILNEEDYIRYPKTSNSLIKFVNKNSEGVDIPTIAKVLMMTEKEVEAIYEEAVEILKEGMDE
jgi:hypothetical protein